MDSTMKKRWISLFVENQVGVLPKISGLFSGKLYNLDSLTVGPTEDPTVSRMTIATYSDDETFEQIKKQLNRMVEVIKVIDFTNSSVCMKELLYVKVKKCTREDKEELFQIAQSFEARIVDYEKTACFLNLCIRQQKMTRLLSL
jgi:acetolactate synthase-1/3 small subunit